MKKKDGMELTFREFDEDFRNNTNENEYVTALNELPADKRAIFLMYLEEGSVTGLAKKMMVSASVMRKIINEIKEMIKDRGDALLEL